MADHPGSILVLNAGSSSLKLSLFAWNTEEVQAEKDLAWGRDTSTDGQSHADALHRLLEGIDLATVRAVGHRIVHGGTRYRAGVRIDAMVQAAIEDLARLAPLHNPAALHVIRAAEDRLPGVPQVAAFDTAFHSTLPPESYLYPVPYAWYADWGVRRFGFHGLSHAYCADRAAGLLGRPAAALRLVTCHLGNGCSLAAVVGGRSVATTMGFTPLDGIMMGTRSGAVDPGILLYLLQHGYLNAQALDTTLNCESGLKGIGGDGDMRAILAARARGEERAGLAFDLFVARAREGIGTMLAHLDGLDALVFTGGLGEHAAEVRAAITAPLGWLSIRLDPAANAVADPDTDVATPDSPVRVLVIHTREDLMIARETRRVLGG